MAWLEREFIAVPEDRKNQLVYKWPDVNIRRFSRVIVNADEIALFVRTGEVIGALGPGRHRVDAHELPVLGALVDTLSGGNFYRAELYFVSTREFSGVKFGGRLADIADPVSEQVVTLRAFGEFALTVRDPAELITSLAGTADLSSPTGVQSWSADLLLKSMKVAVTQGISQGDWPVVGLSGQLRPIEDAVLRQTNLTLYEYGLRIARMGNFDITLAPEDAERLKRLAKDVTYIRLTGDFQRYAAGELAIGAGMGMARTGSDPDSGMFGNSGMLGAALGLNAIAPYNPDRSTADAPQSHGTVDARPTHTQPARTTEPARHTCHCGTGNPADARFCMHCGDRLARACGSCGAELAAAARFCSACGTPAEPS